MTYMLDVDWTTLMQRKSGGATIVIQLLPPAGFGQIIPFDTCGLASKLLLAELI
jgi:hypothetical protein